MLLLVMAQQGAVVHELSHFSGLGSARLHVHSSGGVAENTCSECPAFAQVVTPAFSHSIQVPPLGRAEAERSPEPLYARHTALGFTPRSRGPPSRS
jgi:hypothetical protein